MTELVVSPDLTMLPVVGNYFRTPQQQEIFRCIKDNSLLFLLHEPTNRNDPNAFKVLVPSEYSSSLHIGYVQRHSAARLHNFLNHELSKTDKYKSINSKSPLHKYLITCVISKPHVNSSDAYAIPFGIISGRYGQSMIDLFKDEEFHTTLLNKLAK